ncbi:MAG: aspartate aminotransferase family protein [Lachnospiraceae bacterium]|nr:aspartate aminotransferase family protein [Lachnospiraceae bacterium]
METAEHSLLHTYNRFPLILDRGEGMYLYDTEGKRYLDFYSGIGVFALGHHYPGFDDALKAQIDKLLHSSNYFYNEPAMEAAEKLTKAAGLGRVFFTNSGAEAVEGALKTAKKYGFIRDGFAGHEIIAMGHSFHGRTMGALSVTGTAHYREPFYPLVDGIRFADFNDLDSVRARLSDKTIAIITEPLQGEGGVYPATHEFIKGLRDLCDERDMILIFDEIQCGMGRTGKMFAYEHFGVRPDILTTAKALGLGLPVGAFAVTQRVAERSLTPGDHGTTYGGNPLVLCAAAKSVEMMKKRDILAHVNEMTPKFTGVLDDLIQKYEFVKDRRGMGFMQGLCLDEKVPVGEVVKKALFEGLITLCAGGNVLRLLPPLIAKESDIEKMRDILDGVFAGIAA